MGTFAKLPYFFEEEKTLVFDWRTKNNRYGYLIHRSFSVHNVSLLLIDTQPFTKQDTNTMFYFKIFLLEKMRFY